ncbi:aminodeoxychorismate/anthranilate synthase component II [Effusibacillus consociatus]|uniref:Aminodeoxychorismate/anthranilate synthase component II n=1 Tax=Effusibacillus consociatus TaxID=1117041 RepID=A0ABV9Q025_9BACL
MILMIDNYDSFTYNLVQYLGEMGAQLIVKRNDCLSVKDIEQISPDCIVISPGPCTPNEAGVSLETIRYFAGKIPILGVCLGHQSIAQAFGAKVVRSQNPMHGKTSLVEHDGRTIFNGIPSPFRATRYHSLIVERESLPECLEVSAWTAAGEIMGVRHREYAVEGVQFHPEAILTEYGKELLKNFVGREGVKV